MLIAAAESSFVAAAFAVCLRLCVMSSAGAAAAAEAAAAAAAAAAASSFSLWVMQEGTPKTKPLGLEQLLRVSPLPRVPLDNLSPFFGMSEETEKKEVKKNSSSKTPAYTPEHEPLIFRPNSPPLSPPYVVYTQTQDLKKQQQQLFLQQQQQHRKLMLQQQQQRQQQRQQQQQQQQQLRRNHYKPHPPLTPGLAASFKIPFIAERRQEIATPTAAAFAAAAAAAAAEPAAATRASTGLRAQQRQRQQQQQQQLRRPFSSVPSDDCLLWTADATDFVRGISKISVKTNNARAREMYRRPSGQTKTEKNVF